MTAINRRDVILAGGALLLLAVAIVRTAVPDRSRLRPLSIEAFEMPGAAVNPGATFTRETEWSPVVDVYLVGWNPFIALPAGVTFDAELMIYQAATQTRIFVMGQRGTSAGATDSWRQVNLPAGTGFRVQRGQPLKLRYRLTNTGTAPFEARGATALLYFVPTEGN